VRPTILVKLLLAFALPTVALFGVFAAVAHEVTRRDLDAELGSRLTAVAASAATQIRGKYLVELGPGDESDRGFQNVIAKLAAVAQATGARLYVFDRAFASRADTEPGVAIGTHYFQAELDRHELGRVFAAGAQVASVTFEGGDGRTYKAGYAPVYASDEPGAAIVLAIGAQAPAGYFDRLADLRRSLLGWGAALVSVVLVATLFAAALVTRPVRSLAAAAHRIGDGDLAAPVAVRSRDEIGVLAATMETMRGQLAERERALQQMLAGIAHEVRNPLAGMQLFTGILRDELPAGDERQGHVDRIASELGYLERVVSEFLDYARRPRPELAAVDGRGLVDEVVQLVAAEAEAAGLQIEAAGDGATVRADRGQLRRAVLNLARNAIQAATSAPAAVRGDGPHVRIAARATGDQVVLAVWNRGQAIEPAARARLFEPFFTTREKGTGLGLAFVRDIAHDHGGRVEVDSGAGETEFRIIVPAAGPAAA
jgi:signal transduction histidine kinase